MTRDKRVRALVVGGSYGALLASRNILKYLKDNTELTIVSPSTHIYFNFAAPRLLFEAEKLDQCMFDIESQLRLLKSKCTLKFVQGTVTDVDLGLQTVVDGDSKVLEYDYLFIATGTTCDNKVFKLNGTHHETKKEVIELNKKLLSSESIAIVGGGPTGVETAGEIGYYCKGKKIVFYTGKKMPVHRLGEQRAQSVVDQMNDLGVEVVNNLKCVSSQELADGRTEVTLADGSTAAYDTVVFTEEHSPNSDFIRQPELKDQKGFLKVDQYLRLEGYNNVMAIGDVVSEGGQSGVDIYHNQQTTFVSYIKKELGGYNVSLKRYKPMNDVLVLPVSRKGGVGVMHGWNCPLFFVRLMKGRHYRIPHAKRFIG